MSDTSTNRFNATGTTAERLAFTPDPGTPTPTPAQGYTWWDTDLQALYAYDAGTASWVSAGGGGSGTVTNTGTLTDHALIVGNGGTDVSALASLGTTTTVLHGNAAGDPTFGAVALASDVSGDLPLANLAQFNALTIAGNATNSTADLAGTAISDGHTLKRVGTALTSTYFGPASVSLLTSGTGATYTVPAGVYRLKVRVVGGGGGGGGGDQAGGASGAGGGGASGGYAEKFGISTTPGSTFTYTIGAAGAAGAAGNNAGGTGGNTTWDSGGSPVVGNGGTGGGSYAASGSNSAAVGGSGGSATGGDVNLAGQNGDQSVQFTLNHFLAGRGGSNPIGKGGEYLSSGAGAPGFGYGAGGSGGSCFGGTSDTVGGAGTAGVIIVEEFK